MPTSTFSSVVPANWWWRVARKDGGPAVVCDLDGVLSDARGRQHLLEGRRRNWDAFFDACGEDPLIDETARLLEVLAEDITVVLLTARPSRVRDRTLDWLDRHAVRWDLLIMRSSRDFTPSRDYKRRSVRELAGAGLDVRLGIDDDDRNVAVFREEGVPCIYIHSGYYG